MDKIKESVGLERQRNLIIKRYVTELGRSRPTFPGEFAYFPASGGVG